MDVAVVDAEPVGLGVAVGVTESVGVCVGDAVPVRDGLPVPEGVACTLSEELSLWVPGKADSDHVAVGDAVSEGEPVADAVGVPL